MAGIYLHIPFCKSRCIYCDFYSTTSEQQKEAYIKAICKELEQRVAYLNGEKIETIYFGGGTPSQLAYEDFKLIFDTIEKNYSLDNCEEITLEANPDDLSTDYLNHLVQLPFNRISLGCQTFHNHQLQFLNRRHSSEQAIHVIEACKNAGFSNISIDLMYGLPGETKEEWLVDIEQVLKLDIPHISAYHLIYEQGTPLWKMKSNQLVKETEDEESLIQFKLLIEKLKEKGYEHYEISNFCRPGYVSKHNSNYWKGKKYLGCGAAAHSFDGVSRQWNIASINEYMKGINNNTLLFEKEELDSYTQYNEFIITSLRTKWGLMLMDLENRFGKELKDYFLKCVEKYIESEHILQKEDNFSITTKGIFISDTIMSDLLWI